MNEIFWHVELMDAVSQNTFESSLPGYDNGTLMFFQITAFDNVGHSSMSPEPFELMYHVEFINELSSLLLLLALFLGTLLTIGIGKYMKRSARIYH